MRISKIAMAALIAGGLFVSTASANYNKGQKYYNKFIKKKVKLKSTQLIKTLGVKTPDEVEALFKNNAEPLIKKLNESGNKKAAEAFKKLKKKSLNDIKDFLKGVVNGKVPAGCS